MEQRTQEWHLARAGRLTGSQFAAALGLSPYCSRQRLYRVLTGREPPQESTPAMEWGTTHEPIAIDWYECATGHLVEPVGFIPYGEHLGVSPDGLVSGDGSIEVKCPASQVPHERIPEHYMPQCVGVLHITKRKWLDFVTWSPERAAVYRITAEETAQQWAKWEAELIEFYEKFILGDVEPPRKGKKRGNNG